MTHGSWLTVPNETHPTLGDYWGPLCLSVHLCVHKCVCVCVYIHIYIDSCKLPSE